jgi:hypothetical protein
VPFGLTGDIPKHADYTGAGTTDVAEFNLSTGVWYIQLTGAQGPFGRGRGNTPVVNSVLTVMQAAGLDGLSP